MRTTLLPLLALAACSGSSAAEPAAPSTATGTIVPVLEHHGGPRRDGAFVDPDLTRAVAATFRLDPGFRAALPGAIYAQPLFVPGGGGKPDLLVAASERNVVGAFDPRSGAPAWTRTLAPPAPLSSLPCGNIDPLGVTGTPVVDPATRTLYLDAMTTDDGGKTHRHRLYALSLDGGAVRDGWPVDVGAAVPGFDASLQNQRGALALVGGRLYVPFGGFYGDCGDYRGWLVAVSTADPRQVSAWRTGARGGGSWGPSGVASDGARVFLATGNTFGATTWAWGEAVVAFTAGAAVGPTPLDAFAPPNWKELDAGDVDIGGSGPVLVDLPGATPAALAVALGKDGKLYLLERGRLGGVGGALSVKTVSSEEIINAAAAYTTAAGTYVVFRGAGQGCPAGAGDLTAVRLVPGAPPTAQVAWCADAGGRGSPMVTTTDGRAEALVWVVGAEGDGKLRAYDGDTGAPVFTGGPVPDKVRRFQSPIPSDGRIYVAADGGVRAFVR
jgi:hypothetical protein